jgi:hypothetical protein
MCEHENVRKYYKRHLTQATIKGCVLEIYIIEPGTNSNVYTLDNIYHIQSLSFLPILDAIQKLPKTFIKMLLINRPEGHVV